jgi:hypothetical protein
MLVDSTEPIYWKLPVVRLGDWATMYLSVVEVQPRQMALDDGQEKFVMHSS